MGLSLDQKIQVLNAAGTWVAGIATFVAVAISLYAIFSQRERLRVRFMLRSQRDAEGMTALYVQVVNLSSFDVALDRVVLVTKDSDGCLSEHPMATTEAMPIIIEARRNKQFSMSMRASMYASLDRLSHAFAETGTGIIARTPRFGAFSGEKLKTILDKAES